MFCETKAKKPNFGFTRSTKTRKPSIFTRPRHTIKVGPTSRKVEELSAALATKLTENSSVVKPRLWATQPKSYAKQLCYFYSTSNSVVSKLDCYEDSNLE